MRSACPDEARAEQHRALRELLVELRQSSAGRAVRHALAAGARTAPLLQAVHDAAAELSLELHWLTLGSELPADCQGSPIELAQLHQACALRDQHQMHGLSLLLVAADFVLSPLELAHLVEPLLAQQTLLLVPRVPAQRDAQLGALADAITQRRVFSVQQADAYGSAWLALRLRRNSHV